MNQAKPKADEYKISLSDIRGVGPKTVAKLQKAGIESVADLHLLRKRSGAAYNNLKNDVGSDTLEHLRAVGKAVHYSNAGRVKAKHLTGSITNDAEFSSSFIDINADEPEPESENEPAEFTEPTTDELQSALDRIHDEYGEGYGEQVSFEADHAGFLHESESFDGDDKLPTGIVQSVIRYRHNADTVEAQGDFEPKHSAILVGFSEIL